MASTRVNPLFNTAEWWKKMMGNLNADVITNSYLNFSLYLISVFQTLD